VLDHATPPAKIASGSKLGIDATKKIPGEGFKRPWPPLIKMDAAVKAKVERLFDGADHSTVFEMRIETLTPPSLVRWQCDGGSSPDWVGTTQEFILEPQGEGEVLLKFCHGGWERGGDHCYHCNTTWGHLRVCLKDYCERGVKNPYFK